MTSLQNLTMSRPFLLILFLGLSSPGLTFNIDTQTPYVVRGNGGERFGFSVALHKTDDTRTLLVGAPTAQTYQTDVESGGAVYQCDIPASLETPLPTTICSSQARAFDRQGNKFLEIDEDGEAETDPATGGPLYNYNGRGYQQENKTSQWLGVNVRSAGEYAVACAHKYVQMTHNYQQVRYDTPPIGKCSVVSADLAEQVTEFQPCYAKTTGYDQTNCLAGISLSVSGDSVLMGAPGANQGNGRAFLAPSYESKTTNYNPADGDLPIYIGYGTALCDVNGDGKEDVIATAPKADAYKGGLYVMTVTGGVQNKQKTIMGNQIGEFFGYSVDCGDVNGDGLADVIVGAPFYSRKTSGQARIQSTGRVYVYYGSRETYLGETPTIIEGEVESNTQFGKAVKVVGDMNNDGYEDVLIGSPYNQNGAVFLHLGSSDGLETEHSQVIRPGDLSVSTSGLFNFGWSIDGGVDMDGNGYPDVLVGSGKGHAVYMRSLPIIDLAADIVIDPDAPVDTDNGKKVDVPDNPSYEAVAVDIKICFTYEKGVNNAAEQSVMVNYTITSDYRNEKGFRMYFKPSRDTPKSQTFSGTTQVPLDKQQICTGTFKAYFNSEIYDFRHVYFKLEADVEESETFSSRVTLNKKMIDDATDRVVMQSGCNTLSGICQADLVLAPVDYTISPLGYNDIAIGRTDYILFNINVTNKGEDGAFLSELSFELPRNIIFNRRQPIGDQTEDDVSHIKCITKEGDDLVNKVICSLTDNSGELKVGSSEIFGISVITTNIVDLSQKTLDFKFKAYVQEPSEELSTLLADNEQTVTIKVGYPAGIELSGRPLRERQPYSNDVLAVTASDTKDIGPDVRHELEVSISEHSATQHDYDNVEIMAYWPLYIPSTRTKFLDLHTYIPSTDMIECSFNQNFNINRGESSTSEDGSSDEPNKIVAPPSKRSAGEEGREKRELGEREEVEATVKTTQAATMNCAESTDDCEPFSCTITKLKVNESLLITFVSTLNTDSVDGAVSMGPYFMIVAVAQSTETNPIVFGPDEKSSASTQLVPVTEEEESGESYDWIIIVAVIVGLVLLLIVMIVMIACCGLCKGCTGDTSSSGSSGGPDPGGATAV